MSDSTVTPAETAPKAPKAKPAKKAKKALKAKPAKKESTRTGKMTEAQADRFVVAWAKDHDMSDTAARKAILHRGVQRLATLERSRRSGAQS